MSLDDLIEKLIAKPKWCQSNQVHPSPRHIDTLCGPPSLNTYRYILKKMACVSPAHLPKHTGKSVGELFKKNIFLLVKGKINIYKNLIKKIKILVCFVWGILFFNFDIFLKLCWHFRCNGEIQVAMKKRKKTLFLKYFWFHYEEFSWIDSNKSKGVFLSEHPEEFVSHQEENHSSVRNQEGKGNASLDLVSFVFRAHFYNTFS